MLKIALLPLTAVLVISVATSPAHAQDWGYVGSTQETFDGSQGYFAPHEACMSQFKGVWCTSQMILEKAPHPLAFGPPPEPVPGGGGLGGAWVNPVITGAGGMDILDGFVVDIAGERGFLGTTGARAMNCEGWSWSDREIPRAGFILVTRDSGAVGFETQICGIPRPAACCGGIPRVPRPLPRSDIPTVGVE